MVVLTAGTATPAIATHDFNPDGYSDILWRDTGGDMAAWLMNGATIAQGSSLGNLPTNWSVVGSRDFNGDGAADILVADTAGDVTMWLMDNGAIGTRASVSAMSVRRGRWSAPATLTATAGATFSGAIPRVTPRSGS